MTRPAGGKPHYRLNYSPPLIVNEKRPRWRCDLLTSKNSVVYGRWSLSSAEAIRRAPR